MRPASLAKAVTLPSDPGGGDVGQAALETDLSNRLRRVGLRPTRPRLLLLQALHESRAQGVALSDVEQRLAAVGNGVSHSSMLNSLRELAYKRLIIKAPGQPDWLKVAEVVWLDVQFAQTD